MISIIIVSYNTIDLLRGCLKSISEAKIVINYEVIVVDNNSKDGSVSMLRNEFPQVKIIANQSNLMFSIANNQGLKVAVGDAYLLLNSDTVVKPGVIDGLYKFLITHKNIGAVGPRLINSDGTLQSQGYPLSPFFWTILKNFNIEKLLPRSLKDFLFPWGNKNIQKPIKVGWIGGACMLISRLGIEKVGLLNEALYFYGEEVEWCWRAKKAKIQVWCVPSIELIHYGGGSVKTLNEEELKARKPMQMNSTLMLVKLTTGIPFNLFLSLIIIVSALMKVIIFIFSRPRRRENINKLLDEIQFVKLQIKYLFKYK